MGIQPVKHEWWGTGMVICLERDAHLHMAQLMPLPFTVPFWYRLTRVPGQRAIKRVFVCVLDYENVRASKKQLQLALSGQNTSSRH